LDTVSVETPGETGVSGGNIEVLSTTDRRADPTSFAITKVYPIWPWQAEDRDSPPFWPCAD